MDFPPEILRPCRTFFWISPSRQDAPFRFARQDGAASPLWAEAVAMIEGASLLRALVLNRFVS